MLTVLIADDKMKELGLNFVVAIESTRAPVAAFVTNEAASKWMDENGDVAPAKGVTDNDGHTSTASAEKAGLFNPTKDGQTEVVNPLNETSSEPTNRGKVVEAANKLTPVQGANVIKAGEVGQTPTPNEPTLAQKVAAAQAKPK